MSPPVAGADSGASPWTRPGFLAAVVLIALVVLAGLIIAVLPSDDNDARPRSSADATATSTSKPATAAPQVTAIPTAAPADVTWSLLNTIAIPQSASAGPAKVTSTTASGYARTPTGALIAAAQLTVRSGVTDPIQVAEHTITRQFLAGPDRDRMLAEVRSYAGFKLEPGVAGVISAFAFNSYTPETAVVSLAIRQPSAGGTSRYTVATTSLQWHDNDWHMVPPPGGLWDSVRRPTTDVSGFTKWGPR